MLLCCFMNSASGSTGGIIMGRLFDSDTVVGLVVNPKGKAMRNVPVSVRSKEGVVHTNKKGIFVWENISLYDTLTLMTPKNKFYDVPVSGIAFMKITVRENDFSTDEAKNMIVDTGYGQTPKSRSTTGGDMVISGDELRETGERNILWAIAGRVSGVKVYNSETGEPRVTLRSSVTLTTDNTPLFVLDGVMVDRIDYVNISDVQQVTIMKNASIYGSRGANGAIIVTTKK